MGGAPAGVRIVRPGQALEPETSGAPSRVVTGRVIAKGLADELKGRFYAVVEAPGGCAYHIALDARIAETLQTGDLISLRSHPEPAVRSIDRAIQDATRKHDGAYSLPSSPSDAARHRARLNQLE